MSQSELKSKRSVATGALKPILFSLLILISGIVIGAGLTLIITGNPGGQNSLPPGPEYMSGRMLRHIAGELKLSQQQQEQLKPIIQQHMKAMDDIRKQASPEISKELKQMNEEILGILDEPQKEIWQDRVRRMQEHFTPRRRHRSPGENRGNRRDPNSAPSPYRYRQSGEFRKKRPPESQPKNEAPPINGAVEHL